MASRLTFDRPIAHRGLHDRARGVIENSRSAFDAAINRGFAIECDVQLSRDGVPVIFHDYALQRLTGLDGQIDDLTADELSRTPLLDSSAGDAPQRLSDLLQQVAGRVLLQIELKYQPGIEQREKLAAEVSRQLARYQGPYVLESFDPHLLTALRRNGCAAPLGIVVDAYRGKSDNARLTPRERFSLRHMLHWPWTRFSFISCYHGALNLPAVRLFRALGVPVTTWTVKTPAERRAAEGYADQIVFEGFDPESG